MKKIITHLLCLCSVAASLCYSQEQCLLVSTHRIDLGTQPGFETFSASFVVYRSGCFPTRDASLSVHVQENENWIRTISPEAFTIDQAFGQTTVRFSGVFPYTAGRFVGTIIVTGDTPLSPQEREEIEVFGTVRVDQVACPDESEPVLSHYPLHMPFGPGSQWEVGGPGSFYDEGFHTGRSKYATDWNLMSGEDLGAAVFPVAPGRVVAVRDGCFNCYDSENNTCGHGPCEACYKNNARFDDAYDRPSFLGDDEDFSGWLGNYVVVEHKFGMTSLYGHLQDVNVEPGREVFVDTQIGTVGNNGCSTGPHLHLAFWRHTRGVYECFCAPSPMIARDSLWVLTDRDDARDIATVAPKSLFLDVPQNFWAKLWIDAIIASGIIQRDQEDIRYFDPYRRVLRSEMAHYLLRGKFGRGYDASKDIPHPSGIFADVPPSHPDAAWIEKLYLENMTAGCSSDPLRYCPNQYLTRAEMAVFLLRALHQSSYVPPAPSRQTFVDVPLEHWAAEWVEQLWQEGITGGCGETPRKFCPDNYVTRAEIAVFLLRAFKRYPPARDQEGFGLLGGPEVAVSVETPEEIAQLPRQADLQQNYPNPFNPGTSIEFVLPRASFVTLKIYDALGKEVATLVSEKLPAGKHQRVWEARGVASGMYVCRIEAGDFVQTKKLMLLR